MKIFRTEKDKMCERIAKSFIIEYFLKIEKGKNKENINNIDFILGTTYDLFKRYQSNYPKDFPKIAEYIADCYVEQERIEDAYVLYKSFSPKKAQLLEEMVHNRDFKKIENFNEFMEDLKRYAK